MADPCNKTSKTGPGKAFVKSALGAFNLAFTGSIMHAAQRAPADAFPPFFPHFVVDGLWGMEYVCWALAVLLAAFSVVCLITCVVFSFEEAPT